MADICDTCGKPRDTEAAAAQAAAMAPREITEGYALVCHRDPFLPVYSTPLPDIRIGDIVMVKLIAGAVPDITAGVYCECADGS